MEPMEGIEPSFFAYKANALPLSYTGMEPITRIELVLLAYQASFLPLKYIGFGARRGI
jgi:hypothetical protein